MPTSGTTAFDLNIRDLIDEAYERAGVEPRGGYQLQTARRSLNLLLLEWANRGLNLWTLESAVLTLVSGTASYALGADTVDVLEASLRDGDFDRPLSRASFSSYAKISNKQQTGRPTIFFVNRKATPLLYLWPTPDSSSLTVAYWRMRRMHEAPADTDKTMDVPFRFLPALVAGLAYSLAVKTPAAEQRIPILKTFYEEEFRRATEEDRDRSPLIIRPYAG